MGVTEGSREEVGFAVITSFQTLTGFAVQNIINAQNYVLNNFSFFFNEVIKLIDRYVQVSIKTCRKKLGFFLNV